MSRKNKPEEKEAQQGRERRQVRVLHAYIGAPSNERLIEPGVYDEDAPELYGLAEYLVEVMKDAVWAAG